MPKKASYATRPLDRTPPDAADEALLSPPRAHRDASYELASVTAATVVVLFIIARAFARVALFRDRRRGARSSVSHEGDVHLTPDREKRRVAPEHHEHVTRTMSGRDGALLRGTICERKIGTPSWQAWTTVAERREQSSTGTRQTFTRRSSKSRAGTLCKRPRRACVRRSARCQKTQTRRRSSLRAWTWRPRDLGSSSRRSPRRTTSGSSVATPRSTALHTTVRRAVLVIEPSAAASSDVPQRLAEAARRGPTSLAYARRASRRDDAERVHRLLDRAVPLRQRSEPITLLQPNEYVACIALTRPDDESPKRQPW